MIVAEHFLAAHVRFAGRNPSADGHICAPVQQGEYSSELFVEL